MARADLIFVTEFWKGIPYRHYGIDCGDGSVIHFAGQNREIVDSSTWDQMEVQRVSLATFCHDDDSRIHVVTVPDPLPSEETIRRAEAALGKKGYHLLENNCEHFAYACKTGQEISWQSSDAERAFSHSLQLSFKSMARFPIARAWLGLSAPVLIRGARFSPWMLASDVVEIGVGTVTSRVTHDPRWGHQVGKGAGVATAAVVGTCCGGPAGGLAMVGLHLATGKLAQQATDSLKRWLFR